MGISNKDMQDKLETLVGKLASSHPHQKFIYRSVDVGDHDAVDKAVASGIAEIGQVDILINNAGLALGAPASFPELNIGDITRMNRTNIDGMMFVTHSVLNRSMMPRKAGTILTVTSTTALEAPPFPGETVYHANKACQEGFTNALRNELSGTNIKVLVLRPGVVATHFHTQRVGFDEGLYESFMKGFEPLEPENVASSALYLLDQPPNISIKALDVVPTGKSSPYSSHP